MNDLERILTAIAKEHLGIPTLETRRTDRLDFHDVAVWKIRTAFNAAFDAGAKAVPASAARRPSPPAPGIPTPFDGYEIHGVKAFGRGRRRYCEQVEDAKADHWGLFGHIPGQGLDCIGDFATREHAEEVFARITGRPYTQQTTTTSSDA
jgi:hypothetical protein